MKKKKRKRKSCIGRRRKYTKSGGKTKHPGQGVIPAPAPAKRPRTTIPHVKTQELPTTTTAKEKRVAIYVYWNDSLGASGPTTWQGRDGAIASIRRELNIPTGSYNTIKKVLEDASRAFHLYLSHLQHEISSWIHGKIYVCMNNHGI